MAKLEQKLMAAVRQTEYPLAAFLFAQRGLSYTVQKIHGDPDEQELENWIEALTEENEEDEDWEDKSTDSTRHVSGQQLCYGLRDYALEQYGLLAGPVLRRWNLHRCRDFGRIIYTLIEADLMQRTEEDSIEDFQEVFDFDTAFSPSLTLSPTEHS